MNRIKKTIFRKVPLKSSYFIKINIIYKSNKFNLNNPKFTNFI